VRRPDDDQRPPGSTAQVPVDREVHVILRFESRDDQVMSAGGQPEFRNALSSGVTENRRAVGNVVRRYRKPVGIVLLDPGRVGDQRIRPAHRERLGGPVVTLAGAIPFCPFPFEPVDMGRDRNPAQPQERKQGRVCRVEDKGDVRPIEGGMPDESAVWLKVSRVFRRRAGKCTNRMPRYLSRSSSQIGALHTTAVHRDLVSPLDQSVTDLFNTGLQTAITRWHAPRVG
jgi:hypothetical protein